MSEGWSYKAECEGLGHEWVVERVWWGEREYMVKCGTDTTS